MSSGGGGGGSGLGSGLEVEKETATYMTRKMLIAAVVVLFVAVLFVVCLHLFARRLRLRRRSNISGDAAGAGEVEDSTAVVPRKGLDAAIVGALPVLVVRAGVFKEGLECSVCLCELADGEKARLLPNCNHGFHLDCIDEWFHSHSTCPLCRDVIAPATASPRSGDTPAGMQSLSLEPLSFPTNVLFWGNEVEVVNTRVTRLEEVPSSSSSSTSSSSQDHSATDQQNMKSNTATRFRSLKRLLTRDKRLVAPISGDVEQGFDGDGQC